MTGIALLLALQAVTAGAPGVQPPTDRALHDYPFAVGERFEYDAKLGLLKLGTGYMEVTGIDTLRGIETFRFEFGLEGGGLGFTINDRIESWTTTADLISLRLYKELVERKKIRKRTYEIFPDSGHYREVEKDIVRPTPKAPLDDTAFFYFMRVTPLVVGKTYRYDRYFQDEKNPLVVKVEKRQKLKLPDGRKVECLVLHPIIGDRGMFAERANARVWLTDDARRIPVQIRSRFPFGTITLKLRKMVLPNGASSTSP
jgi:hypothetical protein